MLLYRKELTAQMFAAMGKRERMEDMEERAEIACLLKKMLENDEPVGSGIACELLTSAGFQVSEATVGRLLRTMDTLGYTQRVGFKGRILTALGRDYVNEISDLEYRQHYSEQLVCLVRSQNLDGLLETLVARRAIEREIARLAALNLNPEQAARLAVLVKEFESATGDRIAHGDVAFHQALAEIAGNKVLMAALDLIRQDAQLSPVLGYIRTQLHRRVFSDHKKILEAVLAKDSSAAERAMVNHIENLISDVKKYWSQANGTE